VSRRPRHCYQNVAGIRTTCVGRIIPLRFPCAESRGIGESTRKWWSRLQTGRAAREQPLRTRKKERVFRDFVNRHEAIQVGRSVNIRTRISRIKADASQPDSEFRVHPTRDVQVFWFSEVGFGLAALSETSASIRVIRVPVWKFLFRRLHAAFPELPDEPKEKENGFPVQSAVIRVTPRGSAFSERRGIQRTASLAVNPRVVVYTRRTLASATLSSRSLSISST